MMRSSFGTSSPASSSPWGELAQRREREEREEQRSTNLERQRTQHERDRALLRHLALPNIITGYVQVAFNVAVLVGVLWAMTWFARAVATDIDLKAEQFRREVASEIVTCAREYAGTRWSESESDRDILTLACKPTGAIPRSGSQPCKRAVRRGATAWPKVLRVEGGVPSLTALLS